MLILIATGSTGYKNAAAKRALHNYRSLSEKDGRVLVAMATLDKPATDGAAVRYLLRLKVNSTPSLDGWMVLRFPLLIGLALLAGYSSFGFAAGSYQFAAALLR